MRARILGVVVAVGVAAWPGPAHAGPQQAGVQVALRALGLYHGPIDGEVGPQTVAAIRAAQRWAHVPASGRIDALTRKALGPLGGPLFGDRVLRAGDFGLDVSMLQFMLAQRGVYSGALDGYLGPEVEVAVRRYQQRLQLVSDGLVGPGTQAALMRPVAVPVRARSAPAGRVYVVQPGDSLTAIAARFGLSLTRLARSNKLDTERVLVIGARLAVPSPPLAETSTEVRDRLDTWSARLGVSAPLVRALAWMESGYQPQVVSPVGARGVLQVLPESRRFVQEVLVGHALPRNLDGDIEVGVIYLRHLLKQFDGNKRLALAAWYQGEAAVRRFGIYQVTRPFVADVLALETRM